MKQRGKTVPVYMNGGMLKTYQGLKNCAEKAGKTFSELLLRGMECATMEEKCGVQLTPGAYFAMQDGHFDVLTRTHLGNGTVLISVTEEAYKPSNGTSGYEDKVRQFLADMEESEV